jgi:hypothetical protein
MFSLLGSGSASVLEFGVPRFVPGSVFTQLDSNVNHEHRTAHRTAEHEPRSENTEA